MITRGRTSAALAATTLALSLAACSGSSNHQASSSGSSGTHSSSGSNTAAVSPSTGPVKGKPFTITIGASGDFITQPEILPVARAQAGGKGYNYDPFFAKATAMFSAPDISICQMENPLTKTDTDISRELSFNAPHEMATAVKKAGFDGCSTANNHAYDRGFSGLVSTREVMAQAGLQAAGPASAKNGVGQPAWYTVKGVKVAQLSYSFSLTNGRVSDPPPEAPWMGKNLIGNVKAAGIERDAAAARAQGADLVLVSLHMGTEYKTQPNAEQTSLAKQLLDSGQVDWIIGNHPHSVEPCQKINGRYVDYALGNTFSGQSRSYFPTVKQGVFATTTFTRDANGKVTSHQKYQVTASPGAPFTVLPASPTSNASEYHTAVNIMGSMGCDATPVN